MCTGRAKTAATSAVRRPRPTTTATAGPATKASTAQKVSSNDQRPSSWSIQMTIVRSAGHFK